MPRAIEYRELEPLERRVAHMRVAGLSEAAIGQFIDVDYTTIAAILKRPRVARYLIALESTFVGSISEMSIDNLNDAIETSAVRAFEIEKDVMERLYAQPEDNIRAQLGAAATAQDILDRAGKRAPTKSIQAVAHAIAPATIEHLARVMQEVTSNNPREDNS